MTTEDCKNFIEDKKYSDVKEYFLSAFKRISMLNEKIMKKIDFDHISEEEYDKWAYLLEDIEETSCQCEDLLERDKKELAKLVMFKRGYEYGFFEWGYSFENGDIIYSTMSFRDGLFDLLYQIIKNKKLKKIENVH